MAALVATRQEEQRAASRALGGIGSVVFLGWPDGELESGLRQRWEVCYWIRRLRPDVVLGHDPWKRYRLHPDHRHAGFLAVEGIVAARDPHFFPEQKVDHHRPSALLLWEADEPDHVEDVVRLPRRQAGRPAGAPQPVPLDDAHRRPVVGGAGRGASGASSGSGPPTPAATHAFRYGERFKLITKI